MGGIIKTRGGDLTLYEKTADQKGHFLFGKYSRDRFLSRDVARKATFHNSIEIIAVVSGEFEVLLSGEWRKFSAGSLIFLDRLTPHSTRSAESVDDLSAYVLVISHQYLGGCFELLDMTFDTVLRDGEPCEEINELIEWGYERFEGMNSDMKAGYATMLFGALKKHFKLHERPYKKQHKLMIDIVDYINSHYSEPLGLDVISRELGYERTYLSKVINGMLGVSLREYINSYRIAMVKRMRENNPEMPITKICEACGFESLNTYYRALKRFG